MGTVIAIDGPAGSGKSTIARALAQRLDLPHVDTGAYYRAATLAVLRAGIGPDDADAVLAEVERRTIDRRDDRTTLDGEDVERAIRTDEVDAAVSAVASHDDVRRLLVGRQRDAADGGGVVEGRDAATVIVPDAQLKVWLTAPAQVRAARRAAQQGIADAALIRQVGDQLERRDAADEGNTHRAGDAIEINTGDLGVTTVVDRIVGLLRRDG